MDGNEKLEQLLSDVLNNAGSQQQLSAALGIDNPAADGTKKENDNE
jgi:predicted component of type VI protein secretion system